MRPSRRACQAKHNKHLTADFDDHALIHSLLLDTDHQVLAVERETLNLDSTNPTVGAVISPAVPNRQPRR